MKLTKRKGFNFFRSYYDVYNELENDSDKIAFIDALLDRQFLGVKPTKLKGMAKFAYISQTNSIDSQVKGFEDKTGIILTPCQPPTDGVKLPPRQQVEEKGEVEVEVEVEEKEENKKKPVFNFRKSLIEIGFNEDLISDWIVVRKNKKASNTKTAFTTIKNEVEKTKLDINEILKMHVIKSWSGFKVSWYLNELKKEKEVTPETKRNTLERMLNQRGR